MNEFTTAHHVLDIGEENRHYGDNSPWGMGYGHVMLLNIRNLVQPVSRGHTLAGQFRPGLPALVLLLRRRPASRAAWSSGATTAVAWRLQWPRRSVSSTPSTCFDPFWMDPEYDLWYKLLNCGLRLPASTGTDWFVCSNNRVYVQVDGEFSYASWIEGMKQGRTFITNGPALQLTLNGRPMGDTVECGSGTELEAEVTFSSFYPIERAELVVNGAVVECWEWPEGRREGALHRSFKAERDGWVAARLWGDSRDSFDQSIYAHSSPSYFHCGAPPAEREADANFFLRSIDESLKWIDSYGRYNNDQQREDVRELFRRGREVFEGIRN